MLSEKLPGAMSKLSYRDVREIIRRSNKGDISDCRLSRIYHVSPQWIREIKRRARLGIPLPGESPLGRPGKPVPPDERDFILAVERTHRLNPVVLETLIEREYGIHIPHNRIWKTLKGVNYVQNTPTKQSRRKWVRFERRHSNSLWQMDFALIGRGEWLLLIIDDASRLLVGYARTKKPTAELA
ncbi:MAG: hypothetical protein QW379_09410 [Thermoplasmata archaeon]